MKRILAGILVALLVVAGIVTLASSSSSGSNDPTYKIELDNAFGLVQGEQFKVGGVPAGKITKIGLDQKTMHALVTIQASTTGFGAFHKDVFCQSRPQSLIGEYFIDCNPGNTGPVLKSGSTIPVSHTASTIPADLLNDIMRLPYRERLTLIVNELGAGLAGNGQNLNAALHRAVPALTETDNLLTLLANDSSNINDLNQTASQLVTELANNTSTITRFIEQANNISVDTNTQDNNLKQTFHNLPPFLEQLRPAMVRLGQTTDANYPVLQNLNAAAGQLDRLLVDIPPFSHSALPALRSLGQASVTGKKALIAAKPVVHNLSQFAQHTPELAQNLAIVLRSLDDRARAVESNPMSPGGKGYTGLEAMLQYVFNQTLDLDYFSSWGHMEAIDGFISPTCGGYATPQTIANNKAQQGAAAVRKCYSFLGPNQPGVNEPDPSNPGGCVADPGGAPNQPHAYGQRGPNAGGTPCQPTASANKKAGSTSNGNNTTHASANKSTKTNSNQKTGPPIDLKKTLKQLFGNSSNPNNSKQPSTPLLPLPSNPSNNPTNTNPSSTTNNPAPNTTPSQTTTAPQALLQYLLAP
jgi:virulence factor Mce-like protein